MCLVLLTAPARSDSLAFEWLFNLFAPFLFSALDVCVARTRASTGPLAPVGHQATPGGVCVRMDLGCFPLGELCQKAHTRVCSGAGIVVSGPGRSPSVKAPALSPAPLFPSPCSSPPWKTNPRVELLLLLSFRDLDRRPLSEKITEQEWSLHGSQPRAALSTS